MKEYVDNKKFIKRLGNFKLFYEFMDRKPEDISIFSGIDDYKKTLSDYVGYKKLKLSDFEIYISNNSMKRSNEKHKHISSYATLIRCPTCGARGYIEHGQRVSCSCCETWIEQLGKTLYVWNSILRKSKTLFGFKYYHKNKKITEKEYENLLVYYKLMGS